MGWVFLVGIPVSITLLSKYRLASERSMAERADEEVRFWKRISIVLAIVLAVAVSAICGIVALFSGAEKVSGCAGTSRRRVANERVARGKT
jgi:hypothetical protein